MSKAKEANLYKEPKSFKEATEELKSIVQALEQVDSDLDKSVQLFRRGSFLAGWAENYLQSMEEEISKITSEFVDKQVQEG